LFWTIDRTVPVTADPFELNVTLRPLNCAMRKRRTSFWSAVSNVKIRALLCFSHYRAPWLGVCETLPPYKYCRRIPAREAARTGYAIALFM